jgi:DNA-binding transcriptional regulator YiaG
MEKKTETFTYEGFGFPVVLVNCPMKKILGEWVIDINISALQRVVFEEVIRTPYPLSGKEIKFMRKFLGMSTTELGKKLGLSHVTIIKWEKKESQIGPSQETYLRLFFYECFKDRDLLSLYKEIRPEILMEAKQKKHPPTLQIQADGKELSAANF